MLTHLHEQTRIAIGVHLQYGVKEITLTGQRVYFLTKIKNTLNMNTFYLSSCQCLVACSLVAATQESLCIGREPWIRPYKE